jgi:hypothetical protein
VANLKAINEGKKRQDQGELEFINIII